MSLPFMPNMHPMLDDVSFVCSVVVECLQVSEGSGKILVTAVGDNSEWGKTISLVTSSGDEQTPLQVGTVVGCCSNCNSSSSSRL
jgi:hypothetical protein